MGEAFWTARGVRQGCPMSPILFNLMTADLEQELAKGGWEGVRIEGKRIYTLAYADDVVILAEKEEELEAMIRRLERYLEGKGLELNAEKSKIVRFRRAGGRMRERVWKWKGKRIEVVKEFKYLGYVVSRNGRQEAHIRDRVKKAGGVMKQV